MKILVVDDNAVNLKLLRAILESYSHVVSEARDGQEALEVLDREDICAVITDILMPRMDGYRLCYEIRSHDRHAMLPIVVYTATYTSPADEKLCYDLGADGYVRKPATALEILTALGQAIAAPHRKPAVTLEASDVLREYSERLVDKLEEKNVQLQRRTEELAEAELQMRNLLAHSPSVIYALDVVEDSLVPVILSDNVERLLGFAASETNFDWWIASIHEQDRDRVIERVRTALSTGGSTVEYRIRHRDGHYVWIQDSNRVATAEDGKPLRLVGVWVDISERKAVEEKLQETLDELERRVHDRTADLERVNDELRSAKDVADIANKSKSQFLSRMSHELRTPMNSILGFGQLLEYSQLDSRQSEGVTNILSAGRHLLKLIDEVLEISQIEEGRTAISLEPVDLGEVVDECISLMVPAMDLMKIDLHWNPEDSVIVRADRKRLRQILINLISNAIKYNIVGGSVWIRAFPSSHGATIEVTDTGRGIPASMLSKMFTPFERLGAASTSIEGTGLGLFLSKALVEAMGGTLTMETQEHKGSAFQVHLQVMEHPGVTQIVDSVQPHSSSEWGELHGRVLIVEDNLMNIQLLNQLFDECPNITLSTAMQGRLGIEFAVEHIPDVILLDLHLPDIHGKDVLRALKADPRTRAIPVIIVTADAFGDQSSSLIEDGAFRCLTKPFVLRELMESIAVALKASARESP